MKKGYETSMKEAIDFLNKCGCDECLETKRLLLDKHPELE